MHAIEIHVILVEKAVLIPKKSLTLIFNPALAASRLGSN